MKRPASRWQGALLVCGKCSKRMDGGFGKGGNQALTKVLKQATGGGRRRKDPIGIIQTKCLGICPDGAVVVIDSEAPESWWLVKRGTDVEVALAEIMAARDGGAEPDQAAV